MRLISSASLVLLAIFGNASADSVADLPLCSASRTNGTCKVVIDRSSPTNPPTLQMYGGQRVVVIVKNALWTERYFLDNGAGQASVKPEVVTQLVQTLIAGPLPKLQMSLSSSVESALSDFIENLINPARTPTVPPRSRQDVPWNECNDVFIDSATAMGEKIVDAAAHCSAAILADAASLYSQIEPLAFPDSVGDRSKGRYDEPKKGEINALVQGIELFLKRQGRVSAQLSFLLAGKKEDLEIETLQARIAPYYKAIDTVGLDLSGYLQRLTSLLSNEVTLKSCGAVGVDSHANCVVLESRTPPFGSSQAATVSVTYSLNVLSLVSHAKETVADASKKRALASVVVNVGGERGHFYNLLDSARWDGSVGLLFSALPGRSFSADPVFVNGDVTSKVIAETRSLPTPVPFVAVNYRLTNDPAIFTWKTNLYVTGLAGINPTTTTADFGAGLSVSWRTLVLSVLAHFGHDTKLGAGFETGDSLAEDFSATLPTKKFWTTAIAVGVSVRVPSISGR